MEFQFQLRFKLERVPELARAYQQRSPPKERELEDRIESVIAPSVQQRGYFTKTEFLDVCRWKTSRTRPRCEENGEDFICETTRMALSATQERLRIEIPTLLDGVDWPTASVLLHFGHKDRYPILDFRALESLGLATPPTTYAFPFWWSYVTECRRLAGSYSMRELDRALWQYSKEPQAQ
jgi:hypothetical protein